MSNKKLSLPGHWWTWQHLVFFFYIIWICLWIIFLGHCATVGLIFFVLHVKYDEFNIHVIIFFLLPSVSEGNSINLVLFFFLPGMFGNMRFVSFTFHPKSSLSFSSLFILVPDLCRYMLVLIATKEHSRSIALYVLLITLNLGRNKDIMFVLLYRDGFKKADFSTPFICVLW